MKKLKAKPFALIGVNVVPCEPEALKEVMVREKIEWRTFADPDSKITRQWNSPATPAFYLIDAFGTIRHKWIGHPGENAIDASVEKLIEETEEGNRAPDQAFNSGGK